MLQERRGHTSFPYFETGERVPPARSIPKSRSASRRKATAKTRAAFRLQRGGQVGIRLDFALRPSNSTYNNGRPTSFQSATTELRGTCALGQLPCAMCGLPEARPGAGVSARRPTDGGFAWQFHQYDRTHTCCHSTSFLYLRNSCAFEYRSISWRGDPVPCGRRSARATVAGMALTHAHRPWPLSQSIVVCANRSPRCLQ